MPAAPGLFYYYPTAIPLNGYGGGVMAATPTPMMRYRTAGAYIPAAAAAAPAPEMMDYTSLYNGVSENLQRTFFIRVLIRIRTPTLSFLHDYFMCLSCEKLVC